MDVMRQWDFHNWNKKLYGWRIWEIRNTCSNKKVLAIGEVGYDFHWDTTTKEEQKEAFIRQIELAKKLNLPLIILVEMHIK